MVVSVEGLFTSPEPESIDATSTQEEAADSDQSNTEHSNLEDFHRPDNSPQQIHDHSSDDSLSTNNRSPPYTTAFWMKFPH